MRAVQYDRFGDLEVLEVRDIPVPHPAPGEVLVQVRAAGINPGEAALRTGALAQMFPSTFPSGQGSDLAGVVADLGEGVTEWRISDEVLGWVDSRSSHAEYVTVPAEQLLARPATLDWPVAGGLFVAGTTAWAAVPAVAPQPGEVVAVSGAAGGVGGLVVQLAVELGATVLGLAGPDNHAWLKDHGATAIDYSDGPAATADRIRSAAPAGIDTFVDTFGHGYVDLAIGLGVRPERINTIIDFEGAQRHGTHAAGSSEAANTHDLAEVVTRLADGRLDLPIAATYPLDQVRAAYAELERRHTRGKIVLIP
ncbi:MAG: NADP-dependent oxidoreductase [Acidobacteriota bacterium]|nr:NADP-dependent oxidoreductase [Acidobacteriota bacterium]